MIKLIYLTILEAKWTINSNNEQQEHRLADLTPMRQKQSKNQTIAYKSITWAQIKLK